MKTETLQLPVFWAPALINGDYTGYSDVEAEQILEFERDMIAEHGQCWCLGLEEENSWFTFSHDAERYGVLGCDVANFTFDTENRK
jgi:hypothetical protein